MALLVTDVQRYFEQLGHTFEEMIITKWISWFLSRDHGVYLYILDEPYLQDGLDIQIMADNAKVFDKMSSCCLTLRLPKDEEQLLQIRHMLEHLATPEGYELSNTFAYIDDNPYQYGRRWDEPAKKPKRAKRDRNRPRPRR